MVDEDPDERRRKFLERNRAAATRCRQKRKVWVMSLEKKAEELTQTNMQLQVRGGGEVGGASLPQASAQLAFPALRLVDPSILPHTWPQRNPGPLIEQH